MLRWLFIKPNDFETASVSIKIKTVKCFKRAALYNRNSVEFIGKESRSRRLCRGNNMLYLGTSSRSLLIHLQKRKLHVMYISTHICMLGGQLEKESLGPFTFFFQLFFFFFFFPKLTIRIVNLETTGFCFVMFLTGCRFNTSYNLKTPFCYSSKPIRQGIFTPACQVSNVKQL